MSFIYKNMAYRKKRTTKTVYGKKRKSAKRRGPKRPALKKMIRREISRNVENKTSQKYVYDKRLYVYNNVSFPTDNIFPVCVDPTAIVLNQGVGQGDRIGNTIKMKKLMFKGTILPGPYDATFNNFPLPLQGKIWIFYDKTEPTDVPVPTSDFFQDGSTVKGFQGDVTDLWSPINTDRYRVLTTRTFKLGFANYSGTGTSAINQSFSNNDFKLNVNFSINLLPYHTKMVKFRDGSTSPSTRGLFCMIAYFSANGAPIASTQYMANVNYMLDCEYEDA